MLIRRIAINASPLITLFKSRQATLLPQLFEEILVPAAVWKEVVVAGPTDIAAQQLQQVDWISVVDSVDVIPSVAAWDLGKGETEVLSLVAHLPGYAAVVDDRAARRCAAALKLPTLGTGAVIVLAKQQGLISQIAPGLQALRNAGLYLSDGLIVLLKQQAGE